MKQMNQTSVIGGMDLSKLFRSLTLGLSLLATMPGATQPTLPDTPAGRMLGKWLDAFNSGDRARMTAFLETYQPERLGNLDGAIDFRKGTGGFDLYSIDKSEPLLIEATVHEREGEGNYGNLQMKVGAGEPAHIVSMGIRVKEPPPGAPQRARLTQEQAAGGWKAEIDRAVAADNFSGAWIWAKGGETLASGAAGMADRDRKIPNTLDTQFRLGSMNKMFTAVSVLQLVQKGKVSLDDALIKYLPDYPNRERAEKVKVRHLLSHTGGTGDFFGPEFDQNRLQLRTLQDYVGLFGKRALKFEPGSRWEYSNYGFILLGIVIEKVTGKSYYDYVRENIFAPAGMNATDSEPESKQISKRSAGYMKQDGKWVSNVDTLPWRGTSAGGGYSTAGDLLKFARALLAHKLIGAELLDEATRPQSKDAPYGFGFQTANRGARSFGHGGGAPGMNGDLQIFPESGQVIVVLANLDPPAAGRAANWLAARMPLQ